MGRAGNGPPPFLGTDGCCRLPLVTFLIPFFAVGLAVLTAAPAHAQQDRSILEAAGLYAPSVWDLEIGAHASELPTSEYIDFACGTGGGPPSLPLTGWTEFTKCSAEEGTGFHEVYFQYDDEPEYWARARRLDTQVELYKHTSAYAIPVIVSALFDGDGFMVGFRMVSDPRVDVAIREKGSDLAGFLMARYDGAEWACENLPRLEGEREFKGDFFKSRCEQYEPIVGLDLIIERHLLRKAGQFAINPADGLPMTGQFESMSLLEVTLAAGIPGRESRLAALADPGPSERGQLIQRALACPGCDLTGSNFKRANLSGANLSGANLSGANFHGATLAGANLSGAILVKANLNRADVKRANLHEADLSEAMMFRARFDGADLSGARLQGAFGGEVQMIGATVTNANLSLMDLREARLNDADFSGSNINNAWLNNAQMARSVFVGANLIFTSLRFASMVLTDFSQADVRGSDLFGANLRGANLTDTDFSHSRLTNVNLSEAQATGAKFVDALLPAGFEPQ